MFLLLAACGKGADKKNAKKDSGPTAPVATPIALPPLGVDKIQRFNFIFDAGRTAYDKAEAAAKKQDWAETRKQAEAALTKDTHHYDAHRLLAIALAQTGEHAAAVDHLATAIAADYYAYGPTITSDPLLEPFRATQHGQALTQLTTQIRDEYAKRVSNALVFIARRSPFRFDKPSGPQWLTSRGELYAFDRETKRYYRLTHTNHQVAGFVRSRAGNEIAVLGYDKADRPKDDGAPLIARAWIQVFDPTEWKAGMKNKVTFGPARVIAAGYGAGDQLLVGHAPAADRWGFGEWTVSSLDRSTEKLTKVTTPMGAPRIELTLDEGRVVLGNVDGVQAAWAGDPARAGELVIGGSKVPVPESGQAAQETVAASPGGAHVAFATAVDPCAKDAAPSLYVATAKGALKHLLTAKSRFATRWLDANTLAYEDGDSAIRLWDATIGREALRIENKAGVALNVLSLASAPLCKQAPPSAEPTGSAGSGDEMPPEEGSGGPVVTPQ